ncbi:NUDIX domain-containing protein [Candidatus Pacearchaeota archaeon]|nr:NUDIX domain-containing protein [Candidatus Pacearchaeota archaeon]MBD3282823.1 NUDIX domain-containing protein [Candidatus Pacearchaeota archaeon]
MKNIIKINFRIAVKAFIIKNNKLFVMKRAKDDIQSPGIWEIPGGRLELGEDPVIGLMREIREETGMYIEVLYPLSVRHFKRDDEQVITMLIFLCKPKRGGLLKLSEEHSEYLWIDLKKEKKRLSKFFWQEVEIFHELNLEKLLR